MVGHGIASRGDAGIGKSRQGFSMRTVPASVLVEDFTVYPRERVDEANVRNLVDAIEAGATLPPLVVELGTGRIVNGFHRRRAYVELFGDDHEITVIEKQYASDRDLFLDAIRYNATQGVPLTDADRRRSVEISTRLSIDATAVAGALSMPVDRLGGLRPVQQPALLLQLAGPTPAMPQKRGDSWAGARASRLTTSQKFVDNEANVAARRENAVTAEIEDEDFTAAECADRLIFLIENDACDFDDAVFKRQCAKLHLLLERAFQ